MGRHVCECCSGCGFPSGGARPCVTCGGRGTIWRDETQAKVEQKKLVAFVGEAPGPSGKIGFDGESGRRLAWLLNTPLEVMRETSIFVNLKERWPGPSSYKHHEPGGKGSRFAFRSGEEQRECVSRVMSEISGEGIGAAVLLGKRAARAFGVEIPFLGGWDDVGGLRFFVVPHPSGCNRWWNTKTNRDAATSYLRALVEKLEAERRKEVALRSNLSEATGGRWGGR